MTGNAPNLISNEGRDRLLANTPSPRKITPELINSRIKSTQFYHLAQNQTVTICRITLDNGYSAGGESACVDPANYNQRLGEKIAYDDAFKKLWPLFGFLLAEQIFQHVRQGNIGSAPTVVSDGYQGNFWEQGKERPETDQANILPCRRAGAASHNED